MSDPTPRFATCSIDDCTSPSARGQSCNTCQRHLCAKHCKSTFHKCPGIATLTDHEYDKSIDGEVAALLSCINVHALEKRASELNNGRQCHFLPGKHRGEGAIMGNGNYHGWLKFEDGEQWLVRIPRRDFSDVPASLVEYLVESEYATLTMLAETAVPAPHVYGYALESDAANAVGVSYILMQALSGKPYRASRATPAQKARVFDDVAGILAELSRHPFPKIGSLVLREGCIEVGPVASNRFVTLDRHGPFDTATQYYRSVTEAHLALIADGQLHHEYSQEATTLYEELQGCIARLNAPHEPEGCTPKLNVAHDPHAFYLKHVDDKGDHLLIDENGNITGIIDWQFARTVPAQEAFGPSLLTADLRALYSSASGLTGDDCRLAAALRERGEGGLAGIAEGDERLRRLQFGLASGCSRTEVGAMIVGIRSALGL